MEIEESNNNHNTINTIYKSISRNTTMTKKIPITRLSKRNAGKEDNKNLSPEKRPRSQHAVTNPRLAPVVSQMPVLGNVSIIQLQTAG